MPNAAKPKRSESPKAKKANKRVKTHPVLAPKPTAKPTAAKPAKPTVAKPTAKPTPAEKPRGAASANKRSAPGGATDKERAQQIAERLTQAMPEPRVELDFQNAFQLLIATILSAQSTDKMVNSVTPALFARFPDAHALAAAEQEEVEELVRKTGFYRNKAKAIRGAAQKLVESFGGEVPKTLEEAITLPGVARKTANVVLGSAYRIPTGFVVDTHVTRVAQRLALTAETDPVKIEQDLCALFPQPTWIDMSHRVLLHGRYTCLAKKPQCDRCPLLPLCPSAEAA